MLGKSQPELPTQQVQAYDEPVACTRLSLPGAWVPLRACGVPLWPCAGSRCLIMRCGWSPASQPGRRFRFVSGTGTHVLCACPGRHKAWLIHCVPVSVGLSLPCMQGEPVARAGRAGCGLDFDAHAHAVCQRTNALFGRCCSAPSTQLQPSTGATGRPAEAPQPHPTTGERSICTPLQAHEAGGASVGARTGSLADLPGVGLGFTAPRKAEVLHEQPQRPEWLEEAALRMSQSRGSRGGGTERST